MKKKDPSWWQFYISPSEQEKERGSLLYDAVAESEGEDFCFDCLLVVAEKCRQACEQLDPDDESEKWLFYSSVFYGVGQLIQRRLEIYQKKKRK